jgi:hypothetical protein
MTRTATKTNAEVQLPRNVAAKVVGTNTAIVSHTTTVQERKASRVCRTVSVYRLTADAHRTIGQCGKHGAEKQASELADLREGDNALRTAGRASEVTR